MLNFIRPPICVTWPVPLHSGHCIGPPVCACPWQVGQVSWRFTWMRAWPPRMAVQKSTVAWYSRSVPGCGPRGRCGCCAPVKMPEKMSLKLPHDADPPAPAAPRHAAPARPGSRKSRSRQSPPAAVRRPRLLARIGLGLRRVDLVGVEAHLVVDLALLLVAQHVVGLGDLLELLLGLLVAGVHVRVIAPRSLAEGLANLLRRGRLLHAKRAVIVLVLSSWPWCCFLISVHPVGFVSALCA